MVIMNAIYTLLNAFFALCSLFFLLNTIIAEFVWVFAKSLLRYFSKIANDKEEPEEYRNDAQQMIALIHFLKSFGRGIPNVFAVFTAVSIALYLLTEKALG